MDQLPEDVLRRIYQHYIKARARHLWAALRSFIRRTNLVRYLIMETEITAIQRYRYVRPEVVGDAYIRQLSNALKSKRNLQAMRKRLPIHSAYHRLPESEKNIRSRRGVKRPLEDFL